MIPFAIVFLILSISAVVVQFKIQATERPQYAMAFIVEAIGKGVAALAASIALFVISLVGSANRNKNEILAFVFGILTIVCAAGMIADRTFNLVACARDISEREAELPDPIAAAILLLRTDQSWLLSISIALAAPVLIAGIVITRAMKEVAAPREKTPFHQPYQSRPTSLPPARTGSCKGCGAPLNTSAIFCNNCGMKI
jgi:hypothetical protein